MTCIEVLNQLSPPSSIQRHVLPACYIVCLVQNATYRICLHAITPLSQTGDGDQFSLSSLTRLKVRFSIATMYYTYSN